VRSIAAGGTASVPPVRVIFAAAALSLVAALLHRWVTPEHFEEWWGYGAFFLVAALAQALYAPLVVVWPTRIVLLLGIGGNLAIVVLYLLTRTVGIPFFGTEAGEVEGVSFIDLCATTSEVGIAVALGGALLRETTADRRRIIVLILAVGLVSVGHVVHLVLGVF
jgi:hypothetical protein